jgi:hypothetical protein
MSTCSHHACAGCSTEQADSSLEVPGRQAGQRQLLLLLLVLVLVLVLVVLLLLLGSAPTLDYQTPVLS